MRTDTVTHNPTVKHTALFDPYLLRLVHSYRPICECGFKGALTSDERAAKGAAARHGRGL